MANIQRSGENTASQSMATREKISQDLKQRIYAAALKKASQQPSAPSRQDVSLQEVTIKSEFMKRIHKVKFMKKIQVNFVISEIIPLFAQLAQDEQV